MSMSWDIHRDIPREGSGDNTSTRKALQMLTNVPEPAIVLDIGYGPGMQRGKGIIYFDRVV